MLVLTACGCQTSHEGVKINFSALLRAYRERLDRKPGRAETDRVLASLKPEQLNDLGVIYEREGRLEKAAWAYRQAIHKNLWYATAHVNLGNVLRKQGRTEEALDRYRKAMSVAPHNLEATNNFADLCAQQGVHLEEAIARLSPLVDNGGPHRVYGLDTLGWLYHLSGDDHRAAATLQTALEEADERDHVLGLTLHEHLAAVYRALKQDRKAEQHEADARRLKALIEARELREQEDNSQTKGGELVGEDSP